MLRHLAVVYPALRAFAEDGGGASHDKMLRARVCAVAAREDNVAKNRYANLFPFDATLAPCSVGYVNASAVTLGPLGARQKYIVAAAPMMPAWYGPDTREAFFTMLLENQVPVVVCLAAFQPGHAGAANYLEDVAFAAVAVTCGPPKRVDAYETRDVTVTSRVTGHSHTLTHVYFPRWPNYQVPRDVSEVQRLLAHVDALGARGTMCVHCSGGVGRSGSFVAALHTWRALRDVAGCSAERMDDALMDAVAELRMQRHPWCVESEEQMQCARGLVAELLHIAL